jgi:hypothetical protein
MLTTIGFILAAYLIHDYFIACARRRRRYYDTKKGSVRQTLVIRSLVSLVIICGIAVSLAEQNEKPSINGFLGTVWAETRPEKINRSLDYFQINGQKSESKPTYVFLNPGTPSDLIKPPKSRRFRKPRRINNAIILKNSLLKKQHPYIFNNEIYAKY